jgi:hypothetical protein
VIASTLQKPCVSNKAMLASVSPYQFCMLLAKR